MDWEDLPRNSSTRMYRSFAMALLIRHLSGLSTAFGGIVGLLLGAYFFDRPIGGAFAGALGLWLILQIAFWWVDRRMARTEANAKNDAFARRWEVAVPPVEDRGGEKK